MSHHIRFVNVKRVPNVVAGVLGFLLSLFILFNGFDNENIRFLALLGLPVWLFLIVDAAMPNKFLVSNEEFGMKHSLVWRKWKWQDIESIKFVEKKWLGLSTSVLVLTTKTGATIELEETRLLNQKDKDSSQQKARRLEKIFAQKISNQMNIAAS